MCGGFATWSAVEKKPRSARQQIAWSRIIDAKPFVIPPSSPVSDAAALGPSEVFFTFFEAAGGAYYEGSAAERAAAAGGNPETFEA